MAEPAMSASMNYRLGPVPMVHGNVSGKPVRVGTHQTCRANCTGSRMGLQNRPFPVLTRRVSSNSTVHSARQERQVVRLLKEK
jgi:hypothetical protein